MITTNIQIANLSCSGCVNTITKNIKAIDGVEDVKVNLETDIVSISHNESMAKTEFTTILQRLGYPEINDKNSFLTKIKSKKSCMIGKISG